MEKTNFEHLQVYRLAENYRINMEDSLPMGKPGEGYSWEADPRTVGSVTRKTIQKTTRK
jgi:hypothetical protein